MSSSQTQTLIRSKNNKIMNETKKHLIVLILGWVCLITGVSLEPSPLGRVFVGAAIGLFFSNIVSIFKNGNR